MPVSNDRLKLRDKRARLLPRIRRRGRLVLACGVAVWLAALWRPAVAQRVIHRVRFGETVKSIASDYYGDQTLAWLVRQINGLAKGRLRAGERIRLPTAWYYTPRQAVSVRRVATRLLGNSRREFLLRELNGLGRRRRLKAGTRLLIPCVVPHAVAEGESFADIALRYYGAADKGQRIAKYNLFRGTEPVRGGRLLIPLSRVMIVSARLEQLTNLHVLGVTYGRPREDREALQEANGLLRRGEYQRVALRLVRLLAREQASDTYIADVYKLLATAYVALGEQQLAIRAFREALLRHPGLRLDPVVDSPKLIRAFAAARDKHGTRY